MTHGVPPLPKPLPSPPPAPPRPEPTGPLARSWWRWWQPLERLATSIAGQAPRYYDAEVLARRAFYAGARAALSIIDGKAEDLPVDAEPTEDQVGAAEERFVRMLEELEVYR
jgi:hypothetical protein